LPDADEPPPQAVVQNKLEASARDAIARDKDTERACIRNAGAIFRSSFLSLVAVRQFIVLHLGFNVHLAI
jgi:hypothetical protein